MQSSLIIILTCVFENHFVIKDLNPAKLLKNENIKTGVNFCKSKNFVKSSLSDYEDKMKLTIKSTFTPPSS